MDDAPQGAENRRIRTHAVFAGLPQSVRLLSEVARSDTARAAAPRAPTLVDPWQLSAPFACMKPTHTFRGVVMKTDPAARLKALAPRGQTPAADTAKARVRVGRETAGRSGKGVTVISGLPLSAQELEVLGARLKKLCGAGGAVRDGIIEIQGEHRDRLVQELIKLGFEAKRSGG
jgi:translation initiation factor 1